MTERHLTQPQVDSIAKTRALRPKESDFKGKPGYERRYKSDGSYRWRYRFQPNNGAGKLTKRGAEVQELFRPFQIADTERHTVNQLAEHKHSVVMKDGNGNSHLVHPALADEKARRDGWSQSSRAGGAAVESGIDGMLWRHHGGVWMPLGRWSLSTPFTQSCRPRGGRRDGSMLCRGIQRDPSGHPWRALRGKWVEL